MRSPRRIATVSVVVALAAAPQLWADALTGETATFTAEVTDRRGAPVEETIVYALPAEVPNSRSEIATGTAVMDQLDSMFVPHILVAQTGTRITFPNGDDVSHHVYSFSEAKSFELPLYKGTVHSPLLFDTPGLVVLGCNIHDNMLGYILIVDTPHFAKTDAEGRAELEGLPAGEYSIHVWTPRLRADSLPAAIDATLGGAEERMIAFQFTEKLFPPHAPDDGTLTWSAY